MLSCEALWNMSQIDITEAEPVALTNIDTVKLDSSMAQQEKIMSYIDQTGNPYCFLSGEVPVRVRFIKKDRTLSQALVCYFTQLRRSG